MCSRVLVRYIAGRVDPGFVGTDVYIILRALFKKMNTKLGTNVDIYLALENKSQRIANLKKIWQIPRTSHNPQK
jgi:hypothetical protein